MRTLSIVVLTLVTAVVFGLACPQSWAVWTGSSAYHCCIGEPLSGDTSARWSDDLTAWTLGEYNTWQSIASRINSVGWNDNIAKPGAVLAFDSYR